MLNRHLYITVNIVIVDVTEEDNAFASVYFSSSKADKYFVSFLGPSRHKHNDTFHQLHRLLVDCCLEAGNLIASIAVRAQSHSAYALWLSITKKVQIPPTHAFHLSPFISPLCLAFFDSVLTHLDVFSVSISRAGLHQHLASGWFHFFHYDDKVSQITQLKCRLRKKKKKKSENCALSRVLNVANRRVKPAVTNRPTLGLYWTISGSHPWYREREGEREVDGEKWSEVEWISKRWGDDNM